MVPALVMLLLLDLTVVAEMLLGLVMEPVELMLLLRLPVFLVMFLVSLMVPAVVMLPLLDFTVVL
jgi:hypothetical protein